MDYAQIIRERRPKLRDNSVNAYALSLKSIAPPENKDMDYLYDTEAILQRLEKYKPNTRKNHLNAAVVVLQGIDTEKAKWISRSTLLHRSNAPHFSARRRHRSLA